MALNGLSYIGEERLRHRRAKELADTCNVFAQPIFALSLEAPAPQAVAGIGALCQEIGRGVLRQIKDPQKIGTCTHR